MTAMTQSGRRRLAVIERLLDALADPARRERTVVAVLLSYVALWTLYGAIAKSSQDIHADMSEQFALSRELSFGYPKHPPLAMVVVRAWFSVFPTADWAYYLLAMANVGFALWIAWRVSARFLDGEKRVVGLALLTLAPSDYDNARVVILTIPLDPTSAYVPVTCNGPHETRRASEHME